MHTINSELFKIRLISKKSLLIHTNVCARAHAHTRTHTHTHTHTHTLFYGPLGFCRGIPRWAGTRKVEPGR